MAFIKKIFSFLSLNNSSSIEKFKVFLSFAIPTFAIATIIIFIIEFIIEGKNYLFFPNSTGFVTFLSIYDFPIKLATVTIILIGIQLTLVRIQQTNKQIEIINDNNRFNNFYKHREEFIKFWGKSTLVSLAYANDRFKKLNSPEALNADHQAMYNIFYYPSYHSFKPILNDNFLYSAKHFLDNLFVSKLNLDKYNIINVDRIELAEIHKLTYDLKLMKYSNLILKPEGARFKGRRKDFYTRKYIYDSESQIKEKQTEEIEKKIESFLSEDFVKFIFLFHIYWAYTGLSDLLSFDGNKELIADRFKNFEENYEQLALENDLSTKYLLDLTE